MSRTIFQKITSSLWVLVSFIPFFNGLGFIYIGNKYANSKWFLEGIVYELPLLLGILTLPSIEVATGFFLLGTIGNYVSMIRSLIVDYTLQKQLDQSDRVEKSFEEKLDDVVDSLWVLISFIPLLSGVGLIYKGKNTPNKSWLTEGIIYEIPWLLSVLTIGIGSVRLIAFKLAAIFYFVSIVRSIMVANEPKPLHENRGSLAEEAEFKFKPKETIKEKINNKKESVDVKVEEGVVPGFQFYKKQFKELEELYPQKEKNALDLIEKRFAPPQLTYTRFKKVVDDSHETFYNQLNAGYQIIELSNVYSTKVEDELKNKLIVLNSIIKSLDKLSEELVLNISKQESESKDDLDNFFDDFSNVTGSVRAYH